MYIEEEFKIDHIKILITFLNAIASIIKTVEFRQRISLTYFK